MALRIGAIAGSCLPIAYATSVSPPDEADARPDAAFLQITAHVSKTQMDDKQMINF